MIVTSIYLALGLVIVFLYVLYCKYYDIKYGWSHDYPPVEIVLLSWPYFIFSAILRLIAIAAESLAEAVKKGK